MQYITIRESVDSAMFMHVSDCCKPQKMCDKAVLKIQRCYNLFLTILKLKKCVKKLLKNYCLQ